MTASEVSLKENKDVVGHELIWFVVLGSICLLLEALKHGEHSRVDPRDRLVKAMCQKLVGLDPPRQV